MVAVVLLVVGVVLAAAQPVGADVSEQLRCAVSPIDRSDGGGDCPGADVGPGGDPTGVPGEEHPGDLPEGAPADDPDRPKDPETDPYGDGEGAPLDALCSEPHERASNSRVRIPGTGPTSTAAYWGVAQLANFIIDKIDNEKNKEKRVRAALDDLAYCFPDHNIVIAKPQDGNLQQMDGSAYIDTVDISGDDYRIYIFETGEFTWADGNDLGWKNRAFHGSFEVSDDRRTVTFGEPGKPERKPGWQPGDEGCQVEGEDLPDRDRYYNMYSPLDDEGSAAAVGMLINDLRRCYPDYNVVAMHSEQDSHWIDEPDQMIYEGRYRLNSNKYHDDEEGDDIAGGRAVFDVYVFEDGTFSNDGDGGYVNWAWYGQFERGGEDDKEVTFDRPAPADLHPDPAHGSGSVDFDDESPAYTEGTYPGTDFDGDKPGDKAELTHSLLDEYSKAFPDTNIITAKQFNDLTFANLSGFRHLAVVDGVDIFAVDEGTVANTGDGGWKNWGFTGSYEYDEDERTVTFG
ncbi:hypothetical protein GCM10028784_10840 [Myceligenerans cantabricum]